MAKVTGQSDKVDRLIRRCKNERHPNIAITVDLLTTGIDMPSICHVVFMRRVKSRILYEQMIGRATRRCDDIGKTVFRIYDPVDIYASLGQVNTIKPLVKDPLITIEQLAGELTDPQQLQIEQQLNQSAALAVVVKRPRDLTRAQLKEVKLLLDGEGYSEANLQSAVRQQSNQDIAASIIGHIRRAALGETLQPFEQRVAQAMDHIYTSYNWQPNQRKWLERLAKQLVFEIIVDREFVNTCFAEHGGAKRLDSVLDKRLDTVLEDLSEALWA